MRTRAGLLRGQRTRCPGLPSMAPIVL